MSVRKDTIFALSISILIFLLVTMPYVIAAHSGGREFVFNGFLLNPIDGNSYLAKMYQGWAGNWRFSLPFTSEPGNGAYMFLFYLGLGHIARIFNFPLIILYHLIRIISCITLLWALWRYFGAVFPDSRSRKLAFALASLGSGMGWLLIASPSLPSDFWVAETYPFLSSFANPHFPLGLALVLFLVTPPLNRPIKLVDGLWLALSSLALSAINPFGVVISLMILGGVFISQIIKKFPAKPVLTRVLTLGIFGLPLLVYDFWVANTDRVFRGWNTQNLTPSPLIWDLIVSLSPALLLAILGWVEWRKSVNHALRPDLEPLIVWGSLGLVLLYMPLGLQRRFMMGLYIPLAGLASFGIDRLARAIHGSYRLWTVSLFLLALPTNLIILLAAFTGIQSHDPQIYLTQAEMDALSYISENTDPGDLILSSPEMGLFIPAYTGRRVIYGHPFETVNAIAAESAVLAFLDGDLTYEQCVEFLRKWSVDYIFYGPRERSLGYIDPSQFGYALFSLDDVVLYRVSQ
jgi:hypothetical protein